MSSILKALRKIDEEKRAVKQAAPDLRVDQGFAAKKSHQLLPICGGVVAGALVVGFSFIWSSYNSSPVVIPPPASSVALSQQLQEASSSQKKDGAEDIEKKVTSSLEVNVTEPTFSLPLEPSNVPTVVLPPDSVATIKEQKVAKPQPTITKTAVDKVPAVVKASAVEVTQPDVPTSFQDGVSAQPVSEGSLVVSSELPSGISLVVTEIFFQEDSVGSMAVVNDLPVMIGSQIDSAVVTAIYPDSVYFLINNMTYAISTHQP